MDYVVAYDRPWYAGLGERLSARTGRRFHSVAGSDELDTGYLLSLEPRYVFFPHWSQRIPAALYENLECVIFHMSDVPFGRGGSPLQNLILRGVADTKLTALKCVNELDAGPVYMKRDLSLEGSAREIFARCVPLVEEMIVEMVEYEPNPIPQVGTPVVFRRRRPEESNLILANTLSEVYDYVRMLDAEGYPHAFLDTPAMRFEFQDAVFDGDSVSARVRVVRRNGDE